MYKYPSKKPQASPTRVPTLAPMDMPPTQEIKALIAKDRKCKILNAQTDNMLNILLNNTMILDITYNNSLAYNLFTPNVKARITPFGDYYGINAVILYFFTLKVQFFSIPKIVYKKRFCNADASQTSTVINYVRVPLSGDIKAARNLSLNVFHTFNSDNKIISIDSDFLQSGLAYGDPPELNPLYIQGICDLTLYGTMNGKRYAPTGTCIGENSIWHNNAKMSEHDYCMHVLNNDIPYGTFWKANSNTTVCRILHSHLSVYNPKVHCAHVSPSGGSMCIDWSYQSYFSNNDF